MHAYAYDTELVRIAIVLGVVVSMLFYDRYSVTTGGVIVSGYLALFLAPGQTKRYSGLATKTTLMENITARGWEGNLEIVGGFTIMVLPLLVAVSAMAYLFLISDVRNARGMETIDSRRRFLEVGFLTVCAFGIVATTLASPLTGPRLFIAPMAVLVIAGVIVTNIVSRPKKLMWLFLVGAIVINIVYLSRVYVVYSTVNRESRERLELLKGAPRGSAVRVPRLSYTKRSRIYIGDDFGPRVFRTLVGDETLLKAHVSMNETRDGQSAYRGNPCVLVVSWSRLHRTRPQRIAITRGGETTAISQFAAIFVGIARDGKAQVRDGDTGDGLAERETLAARVLSALRQAASFCGVERSRKNAPAILSGRRAPKPLKRGPWSPHRTREDRRTGPCLNHASHKVCPQRDLRACTEKGQLPTGVRQHNGAEFGGRLGLFARGKTVTSRWHKGTSS